jgi:hypothetical protein
MKAIKVNTDAYTTEQIIKFAQAQGYVEGDPETFIAEKARELLNDWLAQRMISDLYTLKEAERDAGIAKIKQQVAQTTEIIDLK